MKEFQEENDGYVVFEWNIHGSAGEEEWLWGGEVLLKVYLNK
jgi:hypothetical protein